LQVINELWFWMSCFGMICWSMGYCSLFSDHACEHLQRHLFLHVYNRYYGADNTFMPLFHLSLQSNHMSKWDKVNCIQESCSEQYKMLIKCMLESGNVNSWNELGGSTSRVSNFAGLGGRELSICISDKFPGNTNPTSPKSTLFKNLFITYSFIYF
jgi:hypothetical protein